MSSRMTLCNTLSFYHFTTVCFPHSLSADFTSLHPMLHFHCLQLRDVFGGGERGHADGGDRDEPPAAGTSTCTTRTSLFGEAWKWELKARPH
mgnify:FL=1